MYEDIAYKQLDNLLKERLEQLEQSVKQPSDKPVSDPNKLTLEVNSICRKHGIV